jgi:hypothetical protein
MKIQTSVIHLSVPAALSVGVFVFALKSEIFEIGTSVAYLVGGLLFYSAPHLFWLVIMLTFGFSKAVSHAGFIACSSALMVICSFWLLPGDPSGLPIQWMLYWPLTVVLMVVIPVSTALYRCKQSPNKGR